MSDAAEVTKKVAAMVAATAEILAAVVPATAPVAAALAALAGIIAKGAELTLADAEAARVVLEAADKALYAALSALPRRVAGNDAAADAVLDGRGLSTAAVEGLAAAWDPPPAAAVAVAAQPFMVVPGAVRPGPVDDEFERSDTPTDATPDAAPVPDGSSPR